MLKFVEYHNNKIVINMPVQAAGWPLLFYKSHTLFIVVTLSYKTVSVTVIVTALVALDLTNLL